MLTVPSTCCVPYCIGNYKTGPRVSVQNSSRLWACEEMDSRTWWWVSAYFLTLWSQWLSCALILDDISCFSKTLESCPAFIIRCYSSKLSQNALGCYKTKIQTGGEMPLTLYKEKKEKEKTSSCATLLRAAVVVMSAILVTSVSYYNNFICLL